MAVLFLALDFNSQSAASFDKGLLLSSNIKPIGGKSNDNFELQLEPIWWTSKCYYLKHNQLSLYDLLCFKLFTDWGDLEETKCFESLLKDNQQSIKLFD